MAELTFTLNGLERTEQISEDTSLLELLRERCRLTSPKDACAPSGQCGACVVLAETGQERTTGLAIPALGWLPFIHLHWRWLQPQAEIQPDYSAGRLNEVCMIDCRVNLWWRICSV